MTIEKDEALNLVARGQRPEKEVRRVVYTFSGGLANGCVTETDDGKFAVYWEHPTIGHTTYFWDTFPSHYIAHIESLGHVKSKGEYQMDLDSTELEQAYAAKADGKVFSSSDSK